MSKKKIQVQVNPYLEYIGSILMTGNYNEITAPVIGYGLINEEKNEYSEEVRQFFEIYRTHLVYEFTDAMIPNGFTFSRPVELALSFGENADFIQRYELSKLCLEYCGGTDKIHSLVGMLKALEKESGYRLFYNRAKSYYDSYLETARRVTEAHPYVGLLEAEYGKTQGAYQLVITSLINGNFGIKFEDEESKQSHLYAVLSTNGLCLSPYLLFHEFSHPFINPLTERYDELVNKYADAYERLAPYKLSGFLSGYGDWQECVNEHLVRAMGIHLLRKCNLCEEAEEQLRQDMFCGYKYIPLLLENYAYYDRNREAYPDFESFYPELLKVFAMEFDTAQ